MAMLAVLLAASLAFGESPTPCYEAYRTSGLTQEQMDFEEFRERHDACAVSAQAVRERSGHGKPLRHPSLVHAPP